MKKYVQLSENNTVLPGSVSTTSTVPGYIVAPDWVKEGDSYDPVTEGFTAAPVATVPTLVITALTDVSSNPMTMPENRVLELVQGAETTVTVQMQDGAGNVLPVTQDFTLPIAGEFGSQPRVIPTPFVNGETTFTISWTNPGVWKITEQEVNYDNPTPRLAFETLKIKVSEPGS